MIVFFDDLPIEIQISILRDYNEKLWWPSRCLNKRIRTASDIHFIKNEYQKDVSRK